MRVAWMLRKKCPGTRIVMLFKHSRSEHVCKAFDAGADRDLVEYSAGAKLNAAVCDACARRRYPPGPPPLTKITCPVT